MIRSPAPVMLTRTGGNDLTSPEHGLDQDPYIGKTRIKSGKVRHRLSHQPPTVLSMPGPPPRGALARCQGCQQWRARELAALGAFAARDRIIDCGSSARSTALFRRSLPAG